MKQVADSFVITRGAEGALTFDGSELAEIPPHQVEAVDTNGAGDMFAGAFLYAITRGEDFPTAGRFASLAAGKIVANYGPRLPAADYRALRAEFLRLAQPVEQSLDHWLSVRALKDVPTKPRMPSATGANCRST